MSKVLRIAEHDWNLTYEMEAALYPPCITALTGLVADLEATGGEKADIKQALSGLAKIPEVALTLFYAGLLEYHGPSGDGLINSMSDAKKLVKQYFEEQAESGEGNFYALLEACVNQMTSDNFLRRIGLEDIASQSKTPQDHKKKAATKKTA